MTPRNARLIYRNEILIAPTCCGVRREQCKKTSAWLVGQSVECLDDTQLGVLCDPWPV